MQLANCQACPLFKNNPGYCTPIPGYGYGNIVITLKPDFNSILGGIPSSLEYDFLKKIFTKLNKSFYYTHAVKCLGVVTTDIVTTCTKTWLVNELKHSIIFTLGETSKLFTKEKINKIVGQQLKYGEHTVVHLYSTYYVLQRGKKECIAFENIIEKYAL